jgi:hypothetical protein
MRGRDGGGFVEVVGGLGRSFGMVCAWFQPFPARCGFLPAEAADGSPHGKAWACSEDCSVISVNGSFQ